ncbi:glycerate kinase type-2 family protein [Oceaniglobus ichthyenteri]|uniref:glycerate kinase type-2 family protein n=1 Tax=Oceaniglobus ichthyenteri TaxID=2136177 RepID=UPI000D37C55E|nr:DUF4147 domain-containing protein [Oceaniglobus ichthyenteri]
MHTTEDLRQVARRMFLCAVAQADPAAALTRFLGHTPFPKAKGQTILIAIGKAAPAMMGAALAHVTGPHRALCITHHENTAPCPGATLMHAGHPVPDAAGLAAGQAVIALLATAGPDDQVIALISGGGSALVPAPAEGLDLSDKIALNRALLASGLDIVEMNMIRQQVSQLKGGGMLRLAAPAPVTGYILSDVIGDDLNAIASGPTTAPIGTRAQARETLQRVGVWDVLPPAMRAHLTAPAAPYPVLRAQNHLIGSNSQSVAAAATAAAPDFTAKIVSERLIGDVGDAARAIHGAAAKIAPDAPPVALLFGGETTVRLTGTGLGGRNQELALRFAKLAHATPLARRWLFLSGGTDGRDGPTQAAGGIVDADTWARITAQGDADALLANNDSNAALTLANDLFITDATGTNVADIQILLSMPV